MKSIIDQGHFGLENLKKRARQALFWPLINGVIEDMIKNCPVCLTFRNRQQLSIHRNLSHPMKPK